MKPYKHVSGRLAVAAFLYLLPLPLDTYCKVTCSETLPLLSYCGFFSHCELLLLSNHCSREPYTKPDSLSQRWVEMRRLLFMPIAVLYYCYRLLSIRYFCKVLGRPSEAFQTLWRLFNHFTGLQRFAITVRALLGVEWPVRPFRRLNSLSALLKDFQVFWRPFKDSQVLRRPSKNFQDL